MPDLGRQLHEHVEALFPICRSITGEGLRETLRYIGRVLPLEVREVPSGTRVLDWTVPPEWTIRDAFVATLGGRRVVDFRRSNLHILQYSMPVDRVVTRQELAAHLYSLPDQPDLIPYRTAYYGDTWGFCVADRDRQALTDDSYHVRIDSARWRPVASVMANASCLVARATRCCSRPIAAILHSPTTIFHRLRSRSSWRDG